MSGARSEAEIGAAFLAACHDELGALKPGNVHVHAAGHGMTAETFERAAAAAAPLIARRGLTIGRCILAATEASVAATGLNTNLGIVLLSAPLAKAAAETDVTMGLRRRLAVILSELTVEDARDAFAAIRLANPAGLGNPEKGDVANVGDPGMTLLAAMQLAAEDDRIARAYVTAFEDIFDVALPSFQHAETRAERRDLAISELHMALLAAFPDTHISRKWGTKIALEVQEEARRLNGLRPGDYGADSLAALARFDHQLKERRINPGTTADFVVATLFVSRLLGRGAPAGTSQKPASGAT